MPLFKANFSSGISAIDVLVNGALIASRAKVNFIAGSGQTVTGIDDSGNARVNVTFGATGATGGYANAVLADAPAVYLRVADPTGTTAADTSGNGRSGTYTGGFTLAQTGWTSDSDKAVSLNGTTGYIDLGGTNGVTIGQADWTVEMAVKPTAFAAAQYVFGGDATGATKMWGLQIDTGGHLLGSIMNQGNASSASSVALTAGVFAHIAAVYTNSNQTITYYVNGSSAGSASWAPSTVSNVDGTAKQRAIGSSYANTAILPFGGVIDEFALWTSALSSTRINAHYSAR